MTPMDFIKQKLELVGSEACKMDVLTTEIAIKELRENFQDQLSSKLNLIRISAPLIVEDKTDFNDDLNGTERKVKMVLKSGAHVSVTQSLAKWKRFSLGKYKFKCYSGMYTNMNALRIDEDLSNLHSYYVDQWDWEVVISEKDRTIEFLKEVVVKIYDSIKAVDRFMRQKYPHLKEKLPEAITFIYSGDLEKEYPDLDPKLREYEACKKYKAVFLMQIGKTLSSGSIHDGRAPDYDDWDLNGDILVYNPVLDVPFELSSMGIRVTKESMLKQLKDSKCMNRCQLKYHQMIINEELPYSIGGGIGQSRLCMFILEKRHIGEVQASEWDEETLKYCQKRNISLL